MSDTSTLDDFISSGVLSLQTGPFGSQLHSYDYVDAGIAVIPTEGIQEGRIDHGVLPKISNEKSAELARHAVAEDDILFARRGAQATGRSALIRHSEVGFICGTGAIRARVNDRTALDPKFLAWFLAMPSTITWIKEQAIGATMPNLNKSIIGRIEVPHLGIEKQREIAAVLGALDDKIELNRKTAATLEAMARALYQSWFVDFDPVTAKSEGRAPAHMDPATAALFPDSFGEDGLPEGWIFSALADLATLNPEKHSKKKHPEVLEYVDLSNTKWGVIEATTDFDWSDAPSRARMALRPGDTIVGTVRPGNGSFSYVSREGLTGSTGFAVLRPKSSRDSALIYCAATDPDTIESLANLADGGAYPAVRPEVVAAHEFVLAPDPILNAFALEAQPLVSRIEASKVENQTLAALRDSLLPRLMSGELRVGEAREQVEAVA